MDGVEVELIGLWIWVSGNTKPYKEQLKKLGFFYKPSKMSWACDNGVKAMSRKSHTMQEIKSWYGSSRYSSEELE